MKILVVNKFLHPVGGVESHVAAVVDWLTEQGHEVVQFGMWEPESADHPDARYFPSQVDFRMTRPRDAIRTLERAAFSRETRAKLAELLDAEAVDAAYVVHIYHQLGTVILDDLERRGIPTVLSIHDYKIACPNYRFYSERTGRICTKCLDHPTGFLWAPALERCWSGSTAAGVALSIEATATRLRRSYSSPGVVAVLNSLQERAALSAGVAPDRIRRIPHPVVVGPERENVARSHVVFVGRLVPEKGVEVLIDAAALSGIPVTIIGSGRSEQELRERAAAAGAPVEFLGAVPPHDVIGHLLGAAALVVPSVWHEVSPLVVYEAISADVPVIASRVGGMVDQLDDGRGILVEAGDARALADAMTLLVRDPASGRELSATARAHARANLSPERWSANLTDAFVAAGATGFPT